MSIPRSAFRVLVPVVLAGPLLLAALGCSSSSVSTPHPATVTSDVTVVLLSSTTLSGLSLDLAHATDFAATTITEAALLATASCADNPQSGRLRIACVAPADFAGPGNVWLLTFTHTEDRLPEGLIGPVTCTGSLPDGSTVVVPCALVF